MTQALAIDAMADSGGEMPLNRNIERGQALRRLKQRLRWNEVVAVAMDEENRRAGFDLGGKFFGIDVGRQYQQSGIADDRHRGSRAAQSDMQRHHRALAEADQRQRGWRQLVPGELGIEKAFEHRRCFVDTDPALIRIAKGQREPLPADRRLTARLGRVRRDEGGMRQHFLPGAADLDQVVAVSTIAVQENDKLLRRAGTGRKPRSIECPDPRVRHGRTRPVLDLVTKKQRMWPYSNVIFEYAFAFRYCLTSTHPAAMLLRGSCVMSVTPCIREDTGGRDALFIDCRGPAANASRRRRDRSRIQLRDAPSTFAMFSSLIARAGH